MYTILVIDDEPLIADSIAKLLAEDSEVSKRCTVCKAYNAIDAQFTIENEEISLIVSDVCMPGMDGISFRDMLAERGKEIRFLFISGYADFNNLYKAMQIPGTRFLLKTESDDVIIKNVIELINTLPPQREVTTENGDRFIRLVNEFVENNLEYEGCLSSVADYMKVNPMYLSRLYKQLTGENFSQMVCRMKIDKAKKLLSDSNEKISDIAKAVGFGTGSSFAYFFRKNVGITPKQYRNQS